MPMEGMDDGGGGFGGFDSYEPLPAMASGSDLEAALNAEQPMGGSEAPSVSGGDAAGGLAAMDPVGEASMAPADAGASGAAGAPWEVPPPGASAMWSTTGGGPPPGVAGAAGTLPGGAVKYTLPAPQGGPAEAAASANGVERPPDTPFEAGLPRPGGM